MDRRETQVQLQFQHTMGLLIGDVHPSELERIK